MFQILPLQYQAEFQRHKLEANFAEIEYQNANRWRSNIVSKNELALAKQSGIKQSRNGLGKKYIGFY